MKTYPTSTSNQNVPKDVYLLAEVATMSDEIQTTFYATKTGKLWKVGDWITDKPQPAYLFEICRLTGDCEQMVNARVESYFRCKNGN